MAVLNVPVVRLRRAASPPQYSPRHMRAANSLRPAQGCLLSRAWGIVESSGGDPAKSLHVEQLAVRRPQTLRRQDCQQRTGSGGDQSWFNKVALVSVYFDLLASGIVNANHSTM